MLSGSMEAKMFEYFLYLSSTFAVLFSYLAVETKDLLYSVIFLAGASLSIATSYLLLQAPDIAITEVSVSALVTALFILTLNRTRRLE